MNTFSFKGETYEIDTEGFLVDHTQWDKNFAEGMASKTQIPGGLTKEHWKVIDFIRNSFGKTGKCPLAYETCRENGLSLQSFKALFPTGYLRGACKLAGLTYREGYLKYSWVEAKYREKKPELEEKVYRVDVRGFLVDPHEWDENFAIYKANEMKMQDGLTEKHWQVINFLRKRFENKGVVPTIYETCEENQIDLNEMEKLFPDGYHRGAVKISGLRVR
jgi:tRNA 2-thiouridine synthesizing protein E